MAEARKADGSQTLERGLLVLRMLAENPEGLTAGEIATRLGLHRSIAYRLLTALTRQDFATRDGENRYHAGLAFFTLAEQVRPRLLDIAQPVLHEVTAELDATACLVVAENDFAVAIAVVEPPGSGPRFSYGIGNRDPLDRGAAGIALLAAGPPQEGEPERVGDTRRTGHIVTHNEVVSGTYGIAAPIRTPPGERTAAVNIITHRQDIADRAIPLVTRATERITRSLQGPAGS
ncbi:IclR family transcriptional regulator [Halopolyspora algeriensis]|uniref:IclR family transcriptional regulator n=1 Tax=Halopolyspora algeriensis TaxID=1500506 RepID=A0A368VUZ2_9ACTN|nr:helix-turn-helix domain-containing protein [Halopolyspora algeriensis]RCW45914.1 IclR family transcriptional regulator [Halopolyspora algeriensis]TQM55327.1 IclR family transcriptional regulator [Halopolyspora algeriensis]